jgi:hypothetical protein
MAKLYYDNMDNVSLASSTGAMCRLNNKRLDLAISQLNRLKSRWARANMGLIDVEDYDILYNMIVFAQNELTKATKSTLAVMVSKLSEDTKK